MLTDKDFINLLEPLMFIHNGECIFSSELKWQLLLCDKRSHFIQLIYNHYFSLISLVIHIISLDDTASTFKQQINCELLLVKMQLWIKELVLTFQITRIVPFQMSLLLRSVELSKILPIFNSKYKLLSYCLITNTLLYSS